MPSLYIILEKQIPNAGNYVNGTFLSMNNDEFGQMAKQLGVRPLMDFFSISNEELSSLAKEYDAVPKKTKAVHEENWFAAEDGLQTIKALLQELASSKLNRPDRIEAELRGFARVLELAKASGVRWHLGVDY